MWPLPHKGLGGGLLGFPTSRPTTPRVLASLERALEKVRRTVEEVRGRGKGKGLVQGSKRVKRVEKGSLYRNWKLLQRKGALSEPLHWPLQGGSQTCYSTKHKAGEPNCTQVRVVKLTSVWALATKGRNSNRWAQGSWGNAIASRPKIINLI